MYKISFYVPDSHLETVKESLFEAGAGKIGNYERCAWQVKGEGQFFANGDSAPTFGGKHQLTRLIEYKVEMVCEDKYIAQVVTTLKLVHPYEMPAYSVVKLEQL